MSRKTCVWGQACGDGDNDVAGQLAPPPVGGEKLNKF